MANANLLGEDRFDYVTLEGVARVHLLAVPLRDFQGALDPRGAYHWRAANRRARSIVLLPSGARDFVASVRFDNDPTGLKAMLYEGWYHGVTLNLTASGVVYPLEVEEVIGGENLIRPDRDRDAAALGQWEATARFRRVDGGTVDALLGTPPAEEPL